MYTPRYYQVPDPERTRDFIRSNGFGTLVSLLDKKLWATHLPMMLDRNAHDQEILTGHLSRANPQWKDFQDYPDILAVFQGPHAYISSSWYDHENVPTWNYLAVHVYGTIRILEGKELKESLGRMVDKYESGRENGVSLTRMSAAFVEKEIKGIVGFEILITDMQATEKLSQNRDPANYDRIIRALEKQGDPESKQMADLMKKRS